MAMPTNSGPPRVSKAAAFIVMTNEQLVEAIDMAESMRRWQRLSPEQRAAIEEKRRNEAQGAVAEAYADWRIRLARAERYALTAPIAAVLRLHQPVIDPDYPRTGPVCSHCRDGTWDVQPVDWECETYKAIKGE